MLCTVYHWVGAAWQDCAWSESRCMQEPPASAACLPAQQAGPHSSALQNVNGFHAVGSLGSRHSELLAEHCWTGSCTWLTVLACSCCCCCLCWAVCSADADGLVSSWMDFRYPCHKSMVAIIPSGSVSDLSGSFLPALCLICLGC